MSIRQAITVHSENAVEIVLRWLRARIWNGASQMRSPRTAPPVVLDNSSTHGTAEVKEWLAKNPRVHFHYTPTSASWLNQVEGFFGILGKQSLGVAHFPSKVALREHIDAYIAHWNDDPTPFIWTKPAASIIRSRKRMLDRISHAVHTAPLAKTF